MPMVRVAEDFPGSPLVPVDDGMTDEQRERAWADWDLEWEAAELVDVGLSAADTLAEVRADPEA